MQARFWVDYKGSVVRLKIDRGMTVSFAHGGETDEGYSWTSERYEFDGRVVSCQETTDARDCDGRISRQNDIACLASQLSAGWHDPVANVTFPGWKPVDYSQRDYSAEAMNY